MKETMSDMKRMVARDDGQIYSLASLCKNNDRRVPQLVNNRNLVFKRAAMTVNLIIVRPNHNNIVHMRLSVISDICYYFILSQVMYI